MTIHNIIQGFKMVRVIECGTFAEAYKAITEGKAIKARVANPHRVMQQLDDSPYWISCVAGYTRKVYDREVVFTRRGNSSGYLQYEY